MASLTLKVSALSKLGDKLPLKVYHYRFFQQHSRTLQQIALVRPAGAVLSGAGKPVSVEGVRVTPNLFTLLGVQPRLGRGFLPQESQEGRTHVIVLSDGRWRGRFNADPHVLGRKIFLDGTPYQVVGVTAPHFPFPHGAQLSDVEPLPAHTQYWILVALSGLNSEPVVGEMNYLRIVRLKPQVSISAAYLPGTYDSR